MNRFGHWVAQPAALIPDSSDAATKIMADIGRSSRRRLERRPRIILSARGTSSRVPVRGVLGGAGPVRPHGHGPEAALPSCFLPARERDADRQLRPAAELG